MECKISIWRSLIFLSLGLMLIIHGNLELNINKLVTGKYLNYTYLFCMKYRLQSPTT